MSNYWTSLLEYFWEITQSISRGLSVGIPSEIIEVISLEKFPDEILNDDFRGNPRKTAAWSDLMEEVPNRNLGQNPSEIDWRISEWNPEGRRILLNSMWMIFFFKCEAIHGGTSCS